jgi:hypothetical protein
MKPCPKCKTALRECAECGNVGCELPSCPNMAFDRQKGHSCEKCGSRKGADA